MRPVHLLALGLTWLGTGCNMIGLGVMNAVEAPLNEYNDLAECVGDRHLADRAWHQFQSCNPGHDYTVHFVRGFKDGFADFIEYGGTGAPPVAPPWRYRKSSYETPQGVQAIEDWFAGFHQGSAAAQASGIRQFVVLPMAVPSRPGTGMEQQAAAPSGDSVLPPPRPVKPEEVPAAVKP